MTVEIHMPALSPTMEMGTLAKWLVKEGDEIVAGDLIAEIETDKATMEVEAADEGRLGKIVVAEGTADVPVGAVIAILLEEGDNADDIEAPAGKAAATKESGKKEEAQKQKPEQKPEQKADRKTEEKETSGGSARKEQPAEKSPTAGKAAKSNDSDRIFASPLARRIAEQSGIDLAVVEGSGPGGRIVKRDLEDTAKFQKKSAAPTKAPQSTPVNLDAMGDNPVEEVKLSAMRKVIAQRLTESKQTVPHFYLTVDVAMDSLLAIRKDVNQSEEQKVSVNDFLIKALGVALRKVPDANVQFAGDKLLKFARADVSVAVAIEGGLITPVIRGAEGKGISAIGAEMKDLAERARAGKLKPEEYQGGTVSLSNLGMFGIKQFDAVINPPQAAILAVGAAEERAVIEDGEVRVRTIMTATLSCDHRAIDGAIGARLLTAFKDMVETPLKMLL